jgi:hypothetical protein
VNLAWLNLESDHNVLKYNTIALLIVIISVSLDQNYITIFLNNQSQTLCFFSAGKVVAAT